MAQDRRRRASAAQAEGIRSRLTADPELVLDQEELQALADHGIDHDEVRRIALQHHGDEEVSDHDRHTVRDDLEALLLEDEEPDA